MPRYNNRNTMDYFNFLFLMAKFRNDRFSFTPFKKIDLNVKG